VSASAFERLDLRTIAPQRWKNGAGLTREIAFGGASAADFDWRLSIAEVARDAPFSAFPGVDRCITLLTGTGMRLHSHDARVDHALTTLFAPFRFPGDVALDATLVDGACSDLNVMTRRGRFRSQVDVHGDAATLPAADVSLLWCCAGAWHIGGETLDPMQGLLWRTPQDAITAHPLGAPSALLHIRLCHDHAP
jgi:environmental stress-induced protein Ves